MFKNNDSRYYKVLLLTLIGIFRINTLVDLTYYAMSEAQNHAYYLLLVSPFGQVSIDILIVADEYGGY